MKRQRDEQNRKINELKKQLEELEKAQEVDQDEPEMSVDEFGEEEYDDEEWAEYETNEAAWKNQEETKGTSSKDSSFIFVESARDSPKDASSTTKGKVADDAGLKTKEADPKSGKRSNR